MIPGPASTGMGGWGMGLAKVDAEVMAAVLGQLAVGEAKTAGT